MSELLSIIDTLFMGITLIPEGFLFFYMAINTITMDESRASSNSSSKFRYSTKLKVILTIIWIVSIIIKLAIFSKYPNSFVMGNPNHPMMCLIIYALA